MAKPDVETLKKLVEYRPDGRLFWLEAPKDAFPTEEKFSQFYLHKKWNTQNAGKEAITFTDRHGYRQGVVFGAKVKAHQVVWALHNGRWPERMIDHIDGNPSNNQIDNLREVSDMENCRNMKLRKDNKTGFVGVYNTYTGRFTAQITEKGKTRHIGTFDTFEEAKAARIAEQEKLGFSPRHGTTT